MRCITMKKTTKTIVAIISTLIILSTMAIASVSAQVLYGDANADGRVDAKDVLVLRKYLSKIPVDKIDEVNADVNFDGRLDAKDVLLLRKYLSKWFSSFGEPSTKPTTQPTTVEPTTEPTTQPTTAEPTTDDGPWSDVY